MEQQSEEQVRPKARVWVTGLVALLGVALATVGALAVGETYEPFLAVADASYEPIEAVFGCPGDESLVISNVDCELGVAGAFEQSSTTAAANAPSDRLGAGRAPWCDDFADLRIYGCAADVDVEGERLLDRSQSTQCDDTAPSLHPDGMARLAELNCQTPGSLRQARITEPGIIAVDIESLMASTAILPCDHPAVTYRHPEGKSKPTALECETPAQQSAVSVLSSGLDEGVAAWPSSCRVTVSGDRPTGHGCEGPAWLQDVIRELAENKVRTDVCLALTDPGPECTP